MMGVKKQVSPIRLLAAVPDLRGGGTEHQFQLLMRGLSRSSFDTEVLLWRDRWDFPLPEDLRIHYVKKERAWHAPGAILQTSRLIDRLRPDIVFTQLHYVNLLTGTALRLCRHSPTWVCRFSNDPRSEMKGAFASWGRWAVRRAQGVISCSHGVGDALCEHLGLPADRVRTIPNLLDLEAVQRLAECEPVPRDPRHFVVLHVGRLDPQKNHELLLSAFSRIDDARARLWLVGQGSLRERLEAKAHALGINDRIEWFGFQSNPYRFMKAADCLVLTSHYEGFPNVLVESMACGTPVISTRSPYGPEEIIEHERSGLLTDSMHPAEVAHCIRRFFSSQLRHQIAEQAREQVQERFDLKAGAKRYEHYLREVHLSHQAG